MRKRIFSFSTAVAVLLVLSAFPTRNASANTCASNSDCDDHFSCTEDVCDELAGCINTPVHGSCPGNNNGVFCDGQVTCDPYAEGANETTGCVTTPACQLSECIACAEPNICISSSGTSCNGGLGTCNSGVCISECQTNADCADDGFDCTLATCVSHDCQQSPQDDACNDDVNCTTNKCDPEDEDSDPTSGCVYPATAGFCDDAVTCTDDTCAPGAEDADTDGCVNQPNDASCSDDDACNGTETCDPEDEFHADLDGCVNGSPMDCAADDCHLGICSNDECEVDVGAPCNDSNGICKPDGQCSTCNPGFSPGVCDDGKYCIANEECNNNGDCVPGVPVDVSDGVDCTVDTCTEGADAAIPVHTPNHAACNDSNPCTSDFCHVTAGCIPGIKLSDGSPCQVGLEVGTCQSGTCSDLCEPVLADVQGVPQTALAAIEGTCPTCPEDVVSQWTHWQYRMCVRAASTALYRSKQLTRTERKTVRKAARDSLYAKN
jgi:hypothetical protein